jgi:predicted metal-dependent phosphoesterase TrpH
MDLLENLEKETKEAIEWFAAESKYLNKLKKDLEEIEKETETKIEKKASRKARRALRYVSRCEGKGERAAEEVIKELKKHPNLAQLEKELEVETGQLLKSFSFYAGDFHDKLKNLMREIALKRRVEKSGLKEKAAVEESKINALASEIEKNVDILIKWIAGLEVSLKKVIMDTHLHSKASDGGWTPSEVVDQAKKRGLHTIALTDHDTTYGVKEAQIRGKEIGLHVIPGIEIDADYKSGKIIVEDIELIGLNVNLRKIQNFVDQRAEVRLSSLNAYISVFNNYINSVDFKTENKKKKYKLQNVKSISVEEIIKWRNKKDTYQNPAPFLSRMDIVYYLLEHFAVKTEDVKSALDGKRGPSGEFKKEYKFLFEGKGTKPTFYQAIEVVHAAGGKAILAHPGLSKGYGGGMKKEWEKPEKKWFVVTSDFTPYKFVKDLVKHGLDGIELYNYQGSDKKHAEAQDRINYYFRKMAEKLHLFVTYGSDCHGPKGSGPQMGKFGSYKIIKELVK